MALKRALVLSGGGSRGSYEIGVWEALEEAGLRFHMCFGTSIGAINAAMFLQGDRALAARLWEEITSRGVLRADGEQAAQVERMFGRKREVLPFCWSTPARCGWIWPRWRRFCANTWMKAAPAPRAWISAWWR